jgi:predicted TIM-barrel fold metal-dependent hydrolase
MYEIKRFPYDGTIDADGHVLEPSWLWEEYLEERYADRMMTVRVDDDGLEYLQIDGRPSQRTVKGVLGVMGAMGDHEARPGPERRYMDNIPYGAGDPNERLALLDKEHLDGALLYPTIGLLWECEVTDPELTLAYARAYNRWIADFCRESDGRLVPVAQLTLLDPEGSAAELERAVADGCRGGYVVPFTHTRKAHGHPDHDVLWAKAVELDVPMAVHPSYEPTFCTPIRFDGFGRAAEFHYNVMLRQGSQQALLSFLTHGTLDRFPTLKLGVLESGMGWVGSFLDRADAVYETIAGRGLDLSASPSELFARQCFISGDPDETAAPLIMDHVGPQCFLWATDYPHPDHPGTWVDALTRLVEPLSESTRQALLGDNVRRLYGLTI